MRRAQLTAEQKRLVEPVHDLVGKTLFEVSYVEYSNTLRLVVVAATDEIEAIRLVKKRWYMDHISYVARKEGTVYV